MRAVVGIDISKASSEVAILVNEQKNPAYTMTNDAIDLSRPLGDLRTTVHQPEIIFEATSVHSRHLLAFLEDNGCALHG